MYNIKVESMSCEGCVDAVERILKSADPKAVVKVDLESKNVGVESALAVDKLKEALNTAGYPAS